MDGCGSVCIWLRRVRDYALDFTTHTTIPRSAIFPSDFGIFPTSLGRKRSGGYLVFDGCHPGFSRYRDKAKSRWWYRLTARARLAQSARSSRSSPPLSSTNSGRRLPPYDELIVINSPRQFVQTVLDRHHDIQLDGYSYNGTKLVAQISELALGPGG